MRTKTYNFQCIIASVFTLLISSSSAATPPNKNSSTSCNRTCGGISIPFPFGIGKDCYLNSWYEVVCNSTTSGSRTNVPFLTRINREVVNISLPEIFDQHGLVYIKNHVTSLGCSTNISQGSQKSLQSFNVTGQGSPYFLTDKNRLVAVGCGTKALMTDIESEILGCESSCENSKSGEQVTNSICDGYGCCQARIPSERPQVISVNAESSGEGEGRCKVAFLTSARYSPLNVTEAEQFHSNGYVVVELGWYFSTSDSRFRNPLGCANLTSVGDYFSDNNCSCEYDYFSGMSYRNCYCNSGYAGNPYLRGGCIAQYKQACQNPHDSSDVYSFGVVLVELITGEKPMSRVRSEEGRGLATDFLEAMKENRAVDIIDIRIKEERKLDQVMAVAKLARKCLNRKGKKRPDMREVSIELERIRSSPEELDLHTEDEDEEGDQIKSSIINYESNFVDIDECKLEEGRKRCKDQTCVNKPGWFTCEPKKPGQLKPVIQGVLIGSALLIFAFGIFGLYRFIKQRRRITRKREFFRRNGGMLLKQQLARKEGNVEMSKIFSSNELEKATDNFNKNRVLGQGGQGTVYKGMLVDGRIVAVKRSKAMDEDKVEEFINEVVVLAQINHRNIVKLLGCCLETEVPVLVYEYVTNGDLCKRLRDESDDYSMTWEVRLHIAIEIAGALSYLHSAASFPIYHRDIKTTNILLDEKYQAKVSDFGTSRSVTLDQTHLTTQVAGTFGYVDPEYFQSSKFTDKSDVYSFGVVLVELITGKKPSSRVQSEENRGFAANFVAAVKENRVLDIVDDRIKDEFNLDQVMAVAKLAKRCLNRKGKKRPNMREVSIELERIRSSHYDSEIHIEDDDEEEDQVMELNFDETWDVGITAPASMFNNGSPTSDVEPLVPLRTW
ncbi:hypothetical protein CARUB_v10008263mg [Capsella rubella]|uniref:Protein kinase domain-containing protein n=1 Tax=Capsella rubella TaxID=81985 RepID=R0GUK0_9BRAS|nr:hypothetical protein CARUB_v10008263mg [Capsella rubella]